jgi:hypothetical protein
MEHQRLRDHGLNEDEHGQYDIDRVNYQEIIAVSSNDSPSTIARIWEKLFGSGHRT